MKNNQKQITANSETLDTTKMLREAMTSDEMGEDFVTEDTDFDKSENETEDELNGNDESETSEVEEENGKEQRVIEIRNLCRKTEDGENQQFVITKKFNEHAQNIIAGLLTATKSSVLVVGDHGIGKKTLVKYVANNIANKKGPPELCNYKTAIYEVNIDTFSIISDLFSILDYAKLNNVENVIIYINDFEKMPSDFMDQYENIVSKIKTFNFRIFKFIFIFHDGISVEEYEAEKYADFFKINSVSIDVLSPKNPKEILNVLQYEIAKLEKFHGVTMTKVTLKKLVMSYYARHYTESFDYTLFINVVDTVLAQVRTAGKTVATEEAIVKYYKRSFEIMSRLPKGYNRVTAVHESGHILLALKIPKLYEVEGCSIMRETNSSIEAITCLRKTFYCSYNEEDVIKAVAMILAGRAAEFEILENHSYNRYFVHKSKSINKGASDDLVAAKQELTSWVMNNGVYGCTGINIYEASYAELPEAKKKKIDKVVQSLMTKAYNSARAEVKKNKQFIIQMSNFLLKNYVATPEDIKLIAQRTIRK